MLYTATHSLSAPFPNSDDFEFISDLNCAIRYARDGGWTAETHRPVPAESDDCVEIKPQQRLDTRGSMDNQALVEAENHSTLRAPRKVPLEVEVVIYKEIRKGPNRINREVVGLVRNHAPGAESAAIT